MVAQSYNEELLRRQLRSRATIRRVGLTVSSAVLALSGASIVRSLLEFHNYSVILESAAICAAIGALAGTRFFVFEIDRQGTLYVRKREPQLRSLVNDAVEVKSTGDVRGRGAYAARDIPQHTALGWYEGELLDTAAFFARYGRDGKADYAIVVDSNYVIDGRDLAGSQKFTPAIMNHSANVRSANVGRVHYRRKRCVLFYTITEVKCGQELLFDYGRAYWSGREHLIV